MIDRAAAETRHDLSLNTAGSHSQTGQLFAEEGPVAAVNLSVHVMDTAFGVPAANVQVELRRTAVSGWVDLAEGHTGPDGRLTVCLGRPNVSATFRLEFDLDRYYSTLGSIPLFPRAIVLFRVGETDEDLHLPLVISPKLLLTYGGSADEPA